MATITEDFVSFETAKLLKEKGFDEKTSMIYMSYGELRRLKRYDGICNSNYNDITKNYFEFTAPTLQMAMKWLREKEWVICVIPLTFYCGGNVNSWGYNIWADDNLEVDEENTPKFTTYEQACEAAIKYCLESLI